MRRPRTGVLLPTYSKHSTSQMPSVVRTLAELGAAVDVIVPPAPGLPVDLSSVRVEHDLYVLHKISGLALSLAGALHGLGATIVNPYPAAAALRDKIIATRTLQAAGVPVPATYVATGTDALLPLLEDGPIAVKPYQARAATTSESSGAAPTSRTSTSDARGVIPSSRNAITSRKEPATGRCT